MWWRSEEQWMKLRNPPSSDSYFDACVLEIIKGANVAAYREALLPSPARYNLPPTETVYCDGTCWEWGMHTMEERDGELFIDGKLWSRIMHEMLI